MKVTKDQTITSYLLGELTAEEQKRVEEEFLKAERDKDKDAQRVQKDRAERIAFLRKIGYKLG